MNSKPRTDPSLVRLKKQMQEKGVSQTRVARAVGVAPSMVNKVVNGRAVSRKVLDGIRDLLAVTNHKRG